MVKKVKKKRGERKRSSRKATARRRESSGRRKVAPRARARRSRKRVATKSPRGKATRRATSRRAEGFPGSDVPSTSTTRGLGAEAGGQSGDIEGLSRAELADSESVEELLEEGQAFEAGIVSGVENAPDADSGGVRTRQVPEDDVPREYLDED